MAARVTTKDTSIRADAQTVRHLADQLDTDLMWLSESADPETKCMVYDICDRIMREAHMCVIQGQAPGSFRRTFEKLQKTLIGG